MISKKIAAIALLLAPTLSFSHSGGQDSNGGHTNRKTGDYHCHSESCKSQHKQSNKALKQAKDANRQYSLIYKRSDWPHWSDLDGDCQDSRVETLISHSTKPVTFQDGNRCEEVITGQWYDPYTDRHFTKASKLDVDHRIALKEAHKIGAANWSRSKKKQFANDPINLIPVYLSANRSKSFRFAYEWMPENKAYWCEYIQKRERVIDKYDLTPPKKEIEHNKRVKNQFCR